jgi:F-type H+-transporting ATPase subunit a
MVSFAAEPIFFVGKFPITNTLLQTFLVDGIILAGVFAIKDKLTLIPSGFQNALELVMDGFYGLTQSISPKNFGKIFPYFMGFFFFILVANWSSLLPGVGSIGFFHGEGKEKELIPLLRGAGSDINVTLALALVSAVATHVMSINTLGFKEYISRFLSFNPLYLFIGLLELVSEVTKVISLSFRLFGNIYAGEVVIATISSLSKFSAFIAPLPFLALEIIVGLVQALVFSMLTMTFMAILTTSHHEENHDTSKGGEHA